MGRRLASLVSLVLGAGALVLACAAETKAKDEKLCKPGAYVFCRCQDRQEGAKLCNESGDGYGKCEPCETDSNPEIIDPGSSSSSSGDPFPDGGSSGGPKGSCGDGIVQKGEDCDDKNTDDDDGCSTSCKLSGFNPPSSMNCPGLEVHVWGGAHEPTTTGSTKGSSNRQTKPSCTGQTGNDTAGGAAGDRIFQVVAHQTGTLNVTTSDTNYNNFLYVASACTAGDVAYLACKNGVNGAGGETLTVPVEAGKTYYVFVDGAGTGTDKEGDFRVTFEIP